MSTDSLFKPYKVVSQSRTSLHLQPAMSQKTMLLILRLMPLFILTLGIVLYLIQKDEVFLYVFGAIALLEAVIFVFVKVPSALNMDTIGFNLETLSINGAKNHYFLWSDVEFLRHRMVKTKNSTSLAYDAILKNGKKINFLNFGNYHTKQAQIPEINSVLNEISNREIRMK